MKQFRVVAKMYTKRKHGEKWNEMKQFLQVKKKGLFGNVKWVTVDQEDVPSFAWIHKSCFGDESNWKSKFRDVPNCKFIKNE